MRVSAREIARGRWQLDQATHTVGCGCTYLLAARRVIERRVRACRQHDEARGEDGELR